ncbi:class I SAM-dependent DNA methyltransferase [Hydrogenimonas cancrithermarum]|uniref:Methyltransferase n=1 Tax=Hydrogenimonas cancrithermarum TaxID=2993563 RepID=A0ABM8FHT4_9BACT|nr:class I SAM-dependent methyltransferase [Hydrogenimonas cancrithermarum]BDY11792.1 methyltransferase [Hydrogenimonas cancrithermarum]
MGFDQRAKTWDASDRRQALAEAVSNAIRTQTSLEKSMHLLDIGAGTGLLTRRLMPYVSRVTGVDTSAGMLEELRKIEGPVDTVEIDIMAYRPESSFDGIVSSMTLHHIENTEGLFRHLHGLLKPGGFIALADLAPEDGSFHDHGNEGVHHFGFDEKTLLLLSEKAGFIQPTCRIVHTVSKEGGRTYDIFLLYAIKPLHH